MKPTITIVAVLLMTMAAHAADLTLFGSVKCDHSGNLCSVSINEPTKAKCLNSYNAAYMALLADHREISNKALCSVETVRVGMTMAKDQWGNDWPLSDTGHDEPTGNYAAEVDFVR